MKFFERFAAATLPAVLLTAAGCGIGVQRDLREVKPQQVVLDDMCGVQSYHDTLEADKAKAPPVVATNELERTEGKRLSGGRTRFAFETPLQLETLRRVLRQNWRHVPDQVLRSDRVELEVRWSLRAGVPRVVTEESAELSVRKEDFNLPYHICLSELLFGDSLYRTRREMLGGKLVAGP